MSWNWTDVCPTGLQPWLPPPISHTDASRQLAPCFQQICMQMPLLVLFAVMSAYALGALPASPSRRRWRRDRLQLGALNVRMLATGLLAVVPVLRYLYAPREREWPVDWWLGGFEMLGFAVHFALLRSMRSHGGRSHRGPLALCTVWITLAVLAGVSVASPLWPSTWPILAASIAMHALYAVSLLPGGTAEPDELRPMATGGADDDDDDDAELLGGEARRHRHDRRLGRAQDDANWLSQFTFSWVGALIAKGLLPGGLSSVDDLFELPRSLHVDRQAAAMQAALGRSPRLLWALHRAHGWEFYGIGVLRLVADASGFAGPLLLGGLLSHQSTVAPGEWDAMPYWYALGLFASTLLAAGASTHFGWRVSMLNTKMHISLVSAIYSKSLEARSLDDAKPEIINLMSTDADRVMGACNCFHALWSVPFEIVVSLYLLYTQIGLAFVAGLAFVLALFPLNHFVVKKINEYETRMMAAKDDRMAVCTEALGSAKSIKLMAWEDLFMEKIRAFRRVEVGFLKRGMYLDALVIYLWATTPLLMSLLTFGTSVLTGHRLTAATTFTSVALLNMLMAPLNIVPWALSGLTDAWVSLRRIQELLDLPNIDLQAYYTAIPEPDNSSPNPPAVLLQNATFAFDQARSRDGVGTEQAADIVDFQLRDVSLTVRRGQLVCLRGPLGGGKTSFTNALLARMQNTSGTVGLGDVAAGFGYVAQTAWLQRGTVRDNIVWGEPFNEPRYKRTLFACALAEDLQTLGGDLTGVGEGGQTLSGGQRARVALARAVYQDKEVYLLDDVLSALDGHVANHIVRHCIFGVLAQRTRIVVTDHPALVAYADQMYEVTDGRVVRLDRADADRPLAEFLEDSEAEAKAALDTFELRQDADKLRETSDNVLDEESKEHGTVSAGVLGTYGRAMGWGVTGVVLVMLLTQRTTESLTDLWLAHWVSENAQVNRTGAWLFLADRVDPTSWFNLSVYAGLALGNSVATLARTFLFAFATVRASRVIHERLLGSVFRTQFQFFDTTPLGRLLNRFSTDIDIIDHWLPFVVSYFLSQVSGLLATLLITVAALPWLLLLVGPLTPIYLSLQSRYRTSSRDVRRLSSNALSPLYAHFTETLQGLGTIRAMRAAARFRSAFAAKLERCVRAQLTGYAAETWLTIRLQFMGSLLVGGCGLVAALTAQHASNPGMVGLAISYALNITELLAGVMYAVAQTEQQLIAMERIKGYCDLEAERDADGCTAGGDSAVAEPHVADSWPEAGRIEFVKARLQYRPHLQPALLDVDLETRAGERIGVAGRTGAGKSSLLAALFRVAPLSGGRVCVDGVDVARLPLRTLRSRLALVPQQPFLFAGTVRENMDADGGRDDAAVWLALEQCHAAALVRTLGGLDGRLEKGGGNLSAGQKQLLCLARALLRGSRVVCIDEGTANLDARAEREVQLVLREAFGGATVLMIAHRMTTLVNADRVVVMQAGRVVEQGEVATLRGDERSVFSGMLREQRGMNGGGGDGGSGEEEQEEVVRAEDERLVDV